MGGGVRGLGLCKFSCEGSGNVVGDWGLRRGKKLKKNLADFSFLVVEMKDR